MAIKYYFQTNTNGDPVPMSNRALNIPPKGVGRLRWKQFTPKSLHCCSAANALETSVGRKMRYYVRLNTHNNPIDGSLESGYFPPPNFQFQEVVGDYCCEPSCSTGLDTTVSWSGTLTYDIDDLLALIDAKNTSGGTIILDEAGTTISGTHIDLEINDDNSATFTIDSLVSAREEEFTINISTADCLTPVEVVITANYTP